MYLHAYAFPIYIQLVALYHLLLWTFRLCGKQNGTRWAGLKQSDQGLHYFQIG